jgi:hypothetical protein
MAIDRKTQDFKVFPLIKPTDEQRELRPYSLKHSCDRLIELLENDRIFVTLLSRAAGGYGKGGFDLAVLYEAQRQLYCDLFTLRDELIEWASTKE